jgi:asparagine synthase (glutamine-hydrolysing)
MCGILFLYHSAVPAPLLEHRVRDGLRRLAHRGPDGEGVWCAAPVAIGHRRLAIIDLVASRQPMLDPQQRYVLTYNGEVYNYRELRAALADKWPFRTHGDTEVVLAGLVLYGPEFLKRMEGMWALALWDTTSQTVLLARDRLGKKPLFYHHTSHSFACASELPALASLTDTSWREDPDSTADYFRYGYYLPGTTAYQGVYEVLPGHVAQWSPGKGLQHKAYWTLAVGGFPGTPAQASALLREKMTQAVRRRLVADVEVGAFLSGGVDSSLVVGLMASEGGVTPQTFTVGFAERAFDERPFARQVAHRWGTRHHEHCFTSWDQQHLTTLTLDHVGQPFTDSSLLPTALVSQLASQHVKVVLSGDGGDELFSGYQRYQARTLLRWYTRLPTAVRCLSEHFVRSLPEPMAHHSRSVLKKAHLFYDILERQASETPYVAPVLYSQRMLTALLPEVAQRGHTPPGLPEATSPDALGAMMVADALIYLPQDILTKVDRASMAYSLEARCPFLDREVVELAFSLPCPWHRRGYRGKRMLQMTFGDIVPHTVWQRRKQGFAVPVHQWFRGALGDTLMELVAAQPALPVSRSCVLSLLEAHRSGQRDHGYRLWGIYLYLLWKDRAPWRRS